MDLTRRKALALGGTALAVTLVPISYAQAATDDTDAAIKAFTGGATPGEGGVDLPAPEIAENGNTVPISVEAEGATRIMILAAGNPNPGVGTFNFGPLSAPVGATRIRLAGTQDIVAVAEMSDGSFRMASRAVKVTIGGCGG